MRVTTKDIAAICGVSVGTVDRAINGRPGISIKTRDKILSVAKELNYHPHLLARSLVTGSTMTIGVLVATFNNPFFSELVEAVQRRARRAGYYVYLMLSEYDPKAEIDSLERLRALNVDGIIMFPVNRGREFATYMRQLLTPIVTISNRVLQNWPWVGIDDRAAVEESVHLIASKGYERLIYVTQSREDDQTQVMYVDEQRIQGYRDGIRTLAVDCLPEVITDKAMFTLIEEGTLVLDRRTCIVCSCDAVALDVLLLLKNAGISVPDQVGLMGFDNLSSLKYISPSLATVSYPIQEFGERAFDRLMTQMKGADAEESLVLGHAIVEGETL